MGIVGAKLNGAHWAIALHVRTTAELLSGKRIAER